MIFDTSWSKLRRILELSSASQLVTGGLGVTLAQKKTLQGLAFQSLSPLWRLLRRKSLALSILLRQSNKRNYYTMMLSHTVFSFKECIILKFGSLKAKKNVQLDHNYDVRSKTNEGNRNRESKMMQKSILQIIWSFFLIAEQFRIQSYSNWMMSKTS